MKLMLKKLLTGCAVFLAAGSIDALANQASINDDRSVKKMMQHSRDINNPPFAANTLFRNPFIKHVKDEIKEIALPDDAINKLVINAGFGWGIFSGNIYNGNSNFTLTQLIVSMTPIHDQHTQMSTMSSNAIKKYTIKLNLQPLSKGALSLAIDANNMHVHDFEWKIIKAMGYEKNTISDSMR
jgi:hypothetical protein